MGAVCYSCKGKLRCGRKFCPIYTKAESMFKVTKNIDKDFEGMSPPTIFVGSKFYPDLNVGILSPGQAEEAKIHDDPYLWKEKRFSIQKIVGLRSSLINSRFKANVKDVRKESKLLDLSKEVAMSLKPSSIEFNLKKKPIRNVEVDKVVMPMGPNANLLKAKATENIKIPKPIEKVYSDVHLKAVGAMKDLEKKYNENQISQILSAGVLGLKKNRRLVPTRFSITAVDDILCKEKLKDVKKFESIDKFRLYYGFYLGNYYLVLMFPGVFSYELFEMYLPGSSWNPGSTINVSTDNENYFGRKTYASNCVGGYYAARLPIVEKLLSERKQASVLVFRVETPEYSVPLGVWVVRMAAKNAMKAVVLEFDDKKSLLLKTKELFFSKFCYDLDKLYVQSKLLKEINKQRKLFEF